MKHQGIGNISDETFVLAWVKADSMADLERELGVNREAIKGRANRLRSRGVNIERFNSMTAKLTPERVKYLNSLIEKAKEE